MTSNKWWCKWWSRCSNSKPWSINYPVNSHNKDKKTPTINKLSSIPSTTTPLSSSTQKFGLHPCPVKHPQVPLEAPALKNIIQIKFTYVINSATSAHPKWLVDKNATNAPTQFAEVVNKSIIVISALKTDGVHIFLINIA